MFRPPPARFPCRNFQAENERTQGRKMSMPDLLRLLMENASAKGRFTARNRGGRKALGGHCRPARGPFNGWEQLRGSSDETGPLAVASALCSFFFGRRRSKNLTCQDRCGFMLCAVFRFTGFGDGRCGSNCATAAGVRWKSDPLNPQAASMYVSRTDTNRFCKGRVGRDRVVNSRPPPATKNASAQGRMRCSQKKGLPAKEDLSGGRWGSNPRPSEPQSDALTD